MSHFLAHNHDEHSNDRLKDSNIKLSKLIDYAVEIGLKGIAITDHECLSGHIEAIQKVKQIREEGIDFTLGLGNEIYLVDSLIDVRDNYKSGVTKFPHFILIAKTKRGHEALRKLSTQAWSNSFKTGRMERVVTETSFFSEIVQEYKGELIASSACLGSYLGIKFKEYQESPNSNIINDVNKFVSACKFLFEEDFYLEIQPSYMNDQIEYNKFIIKLAELNQIKVIYTTDTHYLTKEHKPLHRSFLQSQEGDREVDDFYSSTYMMTKEEVWEYMQDYIPREYFEQMANNTLEIANKIEFYDLAQDTIVPQICVPPFNTDNIMKQYCDNYEYISKYYNSDFLIDKYLIFMLIGGMKERNQSFDDKNLSRINIELKELWLISENLHSRLSSYYLLVQEVVDLMWTVSLVGIARGSATGFYICYLLGITQMNPMDFNLCHWRHISAERPELPDVDVDSEADKRPTIFKLLKEKYGYNRVLNIITFKTLKPKASIQTAGRGLGFNNDEIQAISDMIPVERGQQWSLKDCLYGNEELERKPMKEFIKLIGQYDGLLESALDLEGLIVGRSIHASGLYIFNDNFINQNSLMKSPSGEDITCWSMNDSDYCGALKIDCLTIEALDKIRTCMQLLIDDGMMEEQGNLRETYNKYLHPDTLIYENEDMYKLLYNGDIINAFQYEGSVGEQALRKILPQKFEEIVAGNSIMRLANKGGEQPLDRYVRLKNDITQWYTEMKNYKLTTDEISIMEKHLKALYGVADTQEVVMMLSMDENISNFTLTEANKLRKGISKKKKKILEECKSMFFDKGLKCGTRIELLNYVWDVQITPQLGYSFSVNHTTPYSGILMQEMNLAYRYGAMYWKCGCLSVNAGAIGVGKSTDYGKIAKAVSEMNDLVDAPKINNSEEGFTIFNNKILFGLKAISEVGEADIEIIKNNRPFKDYDDFILRCGDNLGKSTVASLIKCGALDEMGDRKELMNKYLDSICEYKSAFTLANVSMLMELGLIDTEIYKKELDVFNVYKSICSKPNLVGEIKGDWYKINNDVLDGFLELYVDLKEEIDYVYSDEYSTYIVKKAKIEKCRNTLIQNMVDNVLKNEKIIQEYNLLKFKELQDKYAKGNIARWEMNSMNYYKTEHELSYVNKKRYAIENFFELPEDPIVNESWITKEGREFKRYKLSLIMGTVLHRDKLKHTVSLLTTDGVLTVKYYDGLFNHYNKTISEIQPNGKKKRIEESWFKRGEKCIIYGFRNGDQFFPRKYKNSVFQHTTMKILEVEEESGEVKVQIERYKA